MRSICLLAPEEEYIKRLKSKVEQFIIFTLEIMEFNHYLKGLRYVGKGERERERNRSRCVNVNNKSIKEGEIQRDRKRKREREKEREREGGRASECVFTVLKNIATILFPSICRAIVWS